MHTERKIWDISWVSLWKVLTFVILAAILSSAYQIILGLFLALAISAGLESAVTFLERRGIPRTLGVILVFLVGVILLIVVAYWVIPIVLIDANTLLSSVNKKAASDWLSPLVNLQDNKSVATILNRLSGQLFSGNFSPLSTLSDIIGSLGLAVAILVSSFYLSLSRDGVERFIRAVLPDDLEGPALRIYARASTKMGHWFRSQVILSVTMGILTFAALYILGVKHALVIAIFAGLFELVPFVGPIISGAFAVIAALPTSPLLALTTLIVFLALHQFESHVLVPLMTRRTVGLHPVIVIISLLIGFETAGFLGGLVAVPAAAFLQEVLEEWSSTNKAPKWAEEE